MLVFLITLVDQIGWGMVIPILPTYSKTFQANAVIIGLLLASYSLIQFFFAPFLGRWSDRVGRKPRPRLSARRQRRFWCCFWLACSTARRAETPASP
jgi:MFS transporter, DHA1 family, tetracycline resistance protein